MGRLLWFLSMALSALVFGTSSAIYATQTLKPTGLVRLGPWEAITAVADTAADPYAHAYIASSGQLPNGLAEGVRFVAVATAEGSALLPACTIVLHGELAISSLWTLTLTQADGTALNAGADNDALTMHSQDIVYNADGTFALSIGPQPAAPNSLLLDQNQPVSLVLHAYDETATNTVELVAEALPQVRLGRTAEGCA